jgi:hypothetical protein
MWKTFTDMNYIILLKMQKDVGYLKGLPVIQETNEFLSSFVTGITSCNT